MVWAVDFRIFFFFFLSIWWLRHMVFTVGVGGCPPTNARVHVNRCADEKNRWSVENSCGQPLTCAPQEQASQQSGQMGGQDTTQHQQGKTDRKIDNHADACNYPTFFRCWALNGKALCRKVLRSTWKIWPQEKVFSMTFNVKAVSMFKAI